MFLTKVETCKKYHFPNKVNATNLYRFDLKRDELYHDETNILSFHSSVCRYLIFVRFYYLKFFVNAVSVITMLLFMDFISGSSSMTTDHFLKGLLCFSMTDLFHRSLVMVLILFGMFTSDWDAHITLLFISPNNLTLERWLPTKILINLLLKYEQLYVKEPTKFRLSISATIVQTLDDNFLYYDIWTPSLYVPFEVHDSVTMIFRRNCIQLLVII